MNIIKESNLGEIKSIFDDYSSSTYYYKILNNKFGESISDLEFAKPIIQQNNGVIIWQSKAQGSLKNYSSLSPIEKDKIANIIQSSISKMESILSSENNQSFLDKVIELPSEESIFYTTENGNTKVILTEWGFIKDDNNLNTGILKKIFQDKSLKALIVNFESRKGESVSGIEIQVNSDGKIQQAISNENGIAKLNNISRYTPLQIISLNNEFEPLSLDITNLNEYNIVIDRTHSLTFNFVNSEGQPIQNFNFRFQSSQIPNKKFTTNSLGEYALDHQELDENFTISTEEGSQLLVEKFPSNNETYKIIVDSSFEDNEEFLEEDIAKDPDTEYDDYANSTQLEFLNWRKKPIKNHPVSLYGTKGKEDFLTDEQGIIEIDSLKNSIEYSIFLNYKKSDWKKDFIHNGEAKHSFVVKKKKFLFWWLPLLLFFLLLSIIPLTVQHHYTVYDKKTRQPIEAASISSSSNYISALNLDTNNLTNSFGKLSISYGKQPIYKQIFKPNDTNIQVQKSGYEILEANVPLGFFKTRKSNIYLSKITSQRQPDPQDPIQQCDSGGDGGEDGKNSIKEFDLIQQSGTFRFEYFTGHRFPDLIKVYNSRQDELTDESLIFTFNDTTGVFGEVELLKFTNRYITVVVEGKGQQGSVWEYTVFCPN